MLELTIDEAIRFFPHEEKLGQALWQLQQVGLGYLRLGQPATTLSGGEAQRLKIARELALSAKKAGRKLYIMDEPTTGLHLEDIRKLAHVLDRLVDAGHTVVLIEHNLDVIKLADWVIDLGPEGGDGGGTDRGDRDARGGRQGGRVAHRAVARAVCPLSWAIASRPSGSPLRIPPSSPFRASGIPIRPDRPHA